MNYRVAAFLPPTNGMRDVQLTLAPSPPSPPYRWPQLPSESAGHISRDFSTTFVTSRQVRNFRSRWSQRWRQIGPDSKTYLMGGNGVGV